MIQLLAGDCLDVLPTLAADSVQCVVCSPPYYALRDYGTATWSGGDAACDHRVWGHAAGKPTPGGRGGSMPAQEVVQRERCGKCGARRIDRQIGLEATPDEYLATMVAVFREVRRVLHPTGSVFCNLGDSYSDKQLLMMPARLALALQADGWWLRSAIVWAKPNPMPESVTDRPTSAYEMVYLLTRNARYFYDADAVREPQETANPSNPGYRPCVQADAAGSPNGIKYAALDEIGVNPGNAVKRLSASGRNLRNVWTLPTQSFSDAHFATFPPTLAERCIRAGTSERGACSQCGAPWKRVVERTFVPQPDVSLQRGVKGAAGQKPMDASSGWDGVPRGTTSATTTGWAPSCRCGTTETRPCVVLDPFAGAGTTLLVADRLQRDAIGIELSPDYTRMAMQRCQDDAPLFTSFPPVETDAQDERMRDLFREAAD